MKQKVDDVCIVQTFRRWEPTGTASSTLIYACAPSLGLQGYGNCCVSAYDEELWGRR